MEDTSDTPSTATTEHLHASVPSSKQNSMNDELAAEALHEQALASRDDRSLLLGSQCQASIHCGAVGVSHLSCRQ